MEDLIVAIEKWEMDTQDWERMSKNTLTDSMKLSAVKLLVPTALSQSLQTLPNMETYVQAKKYIQQQIHQVQYLQIQKGQSAGAALLH